MLRVERSIALDSRRIEKSAWKRGSERRITFGSRDGLTKSQLLYILLSWEKVRSCKYIFVRSHSQTENGLAFGRSLPHTLLLPRPVLASAHPPQSYFLPSAAVTIRDCNRSQYQIQSDRTRQIANFTNPLLRAHTPILPTY